MDKRLFSITFIRFLLAFSFSLFWPFVPLYLHDRGLSVLNIGVFITSAVVFGTVLRFLMGNLGDMFDRILLIRSILAFRFLVIIIFALLVYIKASFFLIFLCLLLNSVSFSMFLPIADSYTADISADRIKGFSLVRMAINGGWVVGTFIGSFLLRFGYTFLFVISSIMPLIALYETIKLSEVERKGSIAKLKLVIPNSKYIGFSFITAIAFMTSAQLTSNISIFAVEELKISKNLIAYLFSLSGILNILFQIPISGFLNRLGYILSITFGGFFFAIGYLVLLFSHNYPQVLVSVIFLTFGEMFLFPVLMASASNRAPEGELGAYMGFWSTFQGLGFSLGPAWGGFLLENMGRGVWAVLSLQSILTSLLLLFNLESSYKKSHTTV